MKCKECKWWLRTSVEAGSCVRSAPAVSDKSGFAVWAFTRESDFCGEFNEKTANDLDSSLSNGDPHRCDLPKGKLGWLGKNGKCYQRKNHAKMY